MLCALYFAQGIPWGFVSVAMLAWLNRPALEVSAETSGAILGVATLPWSFKFVWGPIIDAVRLPGGRRKPWIVLSQFLGVLWLALLLVIPEPESLIHYGESSSLAELFPGLATFIPGPLAWLILLTNIFISMQDVATDALAVESLSEEERGRANGLMYGSSYFGTAAGGAGLGWLTAAFGLRAGVAGYAVLLIAVGLLVVFVRETSLLAGASTDSEPTDSGQADPAQKEKRQPNLFAHVGELALTFIVESLKLRFVFAIAVAFVCKIGIGTLTIILADFLQKQGGWSDTEYTSVTGGTAVMAGLVGSIGGGFVADFVGKRRLAAAGVYFRGNPVGPARMGAIAAAECSLHDGGPGVAGVRIRSADRGLVCPLHGPVFFESSGDAVYHADVDDELINHDGKLPCGSSKRALFSAPDLPAECRSAVADNALVTRDSSARSDRSGPCRGLRPGLPRLAGLTAEFRAAEFGVTRSSLDLTTPPTSPFPESLLSGSRSACFPLMMNPQFLHSPRMNSRRLIENRRVRGRSERSC